MGYRVFQDWPTGMSWRLGETYLVVEEVDSQQAYDRRGPGLNHLAFHAGSRDEVDNLAAEALGHGWSMLYPDRHPWAGGPPSSEFVGHYAAYLENAERFKLELVAGAVAI